FRQLNKTVVLVTHDLAEAAYFADDVALLAAGRVEQRGPMHELIRKPATPFVTEFVRAQREPLEALREAGAGAKGQARRFAVPVLLPSPPASGGERPGVRGVCARRVYDARLDPASLNPPHP